MIGLGLAALALAGLIGAPITRSLIHTLGGEPADAAELARAVSQGDLAHNVTIRSGDTQSLMASLSAMQESLIQVVHTVRQGSESVATASAEIAQGNNDLSARTEQQASALEETAASMEEPVPPAAKRRQCPHRQPVGAERLHHRQRRRARGG